MSLFDQHEPRTHRANMRQREKELARKLQELMEIADEAEFIAALQEEFEIKKSDERFSEILKVWREGRRRGG